MLASLKACSEPAVHKLSIKIIVCAGSTFLASWSSLPSSHLLLPHPGLLRSFQVCSHFLLPLPLLPHLLGCPSHVILRACAVLWTGSELPFSPHKRFLLREAFSWSPREGISLASLLYFICDQILI